MRKNLILIGLPGSGKTTVGRLIAARLGLPFADCDTLMETAEGIMTADLRATKKALSPVGGQGHVS